MVILYFKNTTTLEYSKRPILISVIGVIINKINRGFIKELRPLHVIG